MEDRLRECPFCGSIDEEHFNGCYFKEVLFPVLNGQQPEISDEAIAVAWNTRATDPLLEEMAEALKVVVQCLSHGLQDTHASVTAKQALQEYRERKDAK